MTAMRLLLVALVASGAAGLEQKQMVAANPIRKVVTMLQAMQKKVTEEGEKGQELYDKFMCYCKTSGGDLMKSVEAAKAKVPQLTSSIKEAEATKEQLEKDLKAHQVDRSAAKSAMAEATALREKEAAAYAAEVAEAEANLSALNKAVAAIEKGMGSSFLQTTTAKALQALVQSKTNIMEADRQDLIAFLSNDEEAPGSGEITGILKQLGDTMSKDLADVKATEASSIKTYEELMSAKKKEVAALSKMLEEKLKRVGDMGVEIAGMKADLEDTSEGLVEDMKFAADLEKNCKTKTGEWEEQKKIRSQELAALADTIKILNDDDALDLFKKTLPSASSSFVQVEVSSEAMRTRALGLLQNIQKRFPKHPRINFITMALHGKKIGFDKIIKLIDELVATLKQEQLDDDHKKEYCEAQFDATEDKIKALKRSIDDAKTVIEEAKEGIATSIEEAKALKAGIVALDKSVAEATEQRKEENSDYKELMSSNAAAKELLLFAKNRLNKFYNPKLYKAPPKEAPEEAAAFLQISDDKAPPPPPPESFKAYAKKGEESNGVITMIDMLVADLEKEMTVAETEEKNSQEDYEAMMADSAEKRAQDTKALTDKESMKAELEGELESATSEMKATTKELMATDKYMASLHAECDWMLQYFDVRKEARTSEIDALGKAKAVLSGADYSLVQTGSRARTFLSRV